MSLHDACGLDPRAQDVLLGGDVAGLADPLQVVQVAGKKKITSSKKTDGAVYN